MSNANKKVKRSYDKINKENLEVKKMNFFLRTDLQESREKERGLQMIIYNLMKAQELAEISLDMVDMGELDIIADKGKANVKIGKSLWVTENEA